MFSTLSRILSRPSGNSSSFISAPIPTDAYRVSNPFSTSGDGVCLSNELGLYAKNWCGGLSNLCCIVR